MKIIRHDPEMCWDLYSIKCDICGCPLKIKQGRNMVVGEFLSWGQEELEAEARGWIVEGKTAICIECLNSIGKN